MTTTTPAATEAETRAALIAINGACPTCRGQGTVWVTSTMRNAYLQERVCPTCDGLCHPERMR